MGWMSGEPFHSASAPGGCGRLIAPVVKACCVCALVGLMADVIAPRVYAWTAAEEPQQADTQQATRSARVFGSDAGVVLNFIKPDKTADFEAVVGRLREALQKSEKPERKRQAAGWKVFKALEPGANGSVLYMFVIDPAEKGVDYTVSAILAEAFPAEVQALFQKYADAYASGQNVVNLALVTALGK